MFLCDVLMNLSQPLHTRLIITNDIYGNQMIAAVYLSSLPFCT